MKYKIPTNLNPLLICAFLTLLSLTAYSVYTSNLNSPQQQTQISTKIDDSTLKCDQTLAEVDTDELASLLNQPQNDDVCLFVGCNSFF